MKNDLIQKVDFGNTGLRVSRLAFGTGTTGWNGRSDQSDLGIPVVVELLLKGYDLGVTFWDTADAYGTHPHLARALQRVPRENITLLTKSLATSADQMTTDIERFLKELGTEYIDVVLLHALTQPNWPVKNRGAMQALSKAQEQGKVRAVGVSVHSLSALKAAVQSDWAEVVMVRINYAGTNMDADPEQVVPLILKLHQDGKAVLGMKVVGNGRLAQDVRGALKFIFGLETVPSFSLGMVSPAELIENVRLVGELDPKNR